MVGCGFRVALTLMWTCMYHSHRDDDTFTDAYGELASSKRRRFVQTFSAPSFFTNRRSSLDVLPFIARLFSPSWAFLFRRGSRWCRRSCARWWTCSRNAVEPPVVQEVAQVIDSTQWMGVHWTVVDPRLALLGVIGSGVMIFRCARPLLLRPLTAILTHCMRALSWST